jgi:hypothetical protein
MTPHRIYQAALNSCKHPETRNRIDSITTAQKYAEPGYEQPKAGVIFFGDWNKVKGWEQGKGYVAELPDGNVPKRLMRALEKVGVECEWYDEWTMCDDCGAAMRSQPDSHWWKPTAIVNLDKGSCLCPECAQEH